MILNAGRKSKGLGYQNYSERTTEVLVMLHSHLLPYATGSSSLHFNYIQPHEHHHTEYKGWEQ